MASSKQANEKVRARDKVIATFEKEMKEAKTMALGALSVYGEPAVSLEELRKEVDKELKGLSLSMLIIKEREARW